MMVDHNIYVWDVRRPFVPAAMFEEHRDVTTGIAWRHPHDPSFLLSGSKDSTLCQHLFRDASQPVERANPEGLCYGLFGDLAFAVKESLVAAESGRKPYAGDRRHPIFFKRKLDPAEPFSGLASSALSVFETESGGGSMSWFVDTAERYALTGRPLAELCDHNAKVARELGRNQVCEVGAQEVMMWVSDCCCNGSSRPTTTRSSVTVSAFATVFDSVKIMWTRIAQTKGSYSGWRPRESSADSRLFCLILGVGAAFCMLSLPHIHSLANPSSRCLTDVPLWVDTALSMSQFPGW